MMETERYKSGSLPTSVSGQYSDGDMATTEGTNGEREVEKSLSAYISTWRV